MEIEEIQAAQQRGVKFQYTQQGMEVRRLAQSVGAEVVARVEAQRPIVRLSRDEAELSSESQNGRSTGDLSIGPRPARIVSGLLKSFQGKTSDQGSEHHKKSSWFTEAS